MMYYKSQGQITKLDGGHLLAKWLRGYGAAILSAALVGLFTVLNKWLVGQLPALTAGAWTYFAAGIALFPFAIRHGLPRFHDAKAAVGWLLTGSVFGPALYFLGLKWTSGVEGSLLINLEAVLTALLALLFFKENGSNHSVLWHGHHRWRRGHFHSDKRPRQSCVAWEPAHRPWLCGLGD